MFVRIAALLSVIIFVSSCKPTPPKEEVPEGEGTYFSVKQFIKDQWDTYHGQPFGMQQKIYLNGKVDSSDLSAMEVDWAAVFEPFFESDISDRKYLGHYDFSTFEDDITITRSFYYEAKDPKLLTRKLQIMADPFNNKIKSIYIETEKTSKWSTKTRKLYYSPLKIISIQEMENTNPGPSKDLRVEYRFL